MTARKTPKKQKNPFPSFGGLGGLGGLGGASSSFTFRTPPAPRTPKFTRTTQPLTSEKFARVIDALDASGAHELKYLKLADYLQKTGKLLDIPMPRLQLGYADKAEHPTDRVNFPVMASIYETVAHSDVQQFVQELASIPALATDRDYQDAASAMFRAVGARNRVENEFPGFSSAWEDFFGEQFQPGFMSLPNMVQDEDRKLLFEAMASIVSGKVTTPELRPYEHLLEGATQAFQTGTVQEFGDHLYALSAEMTQLPPPEPPSDPDDEPDEDEQDDGTPPPGQPPEQDEDQDNECENPGSGGSGEGDGGEDEQDGDPQGGSGGSGDEDGGDEQGGSGQPAPGSGNAPGGGEDEQDPFAKLAQFMRQTDPAGMPSPESINAAGQFEMEHPDFDPESAKELLELQADISIPDTAPGLESVFMRTPSPVGGQALWGLFKRTYASQVADAVRLIDEFYRVKTIQERGLMTGRADGARLYKVNYGTRDVFKRAQVDSVGHMDMLLLIDESGSMCSDVEGEFKLPNERLFRDSSANITSSNLELLAGTGVGPLDTDRANLSRIAAFLLLEASRSLDGFNVEVAGYTGLIEGQMPEKMRPIHRAVQELYSQRGGRHGGGYLSSYMPVVRLMGDKRSPYGVMTSSHMSDNADIQALAWGIERLEKSSADQKCIVFIADGCVSDEDDLMGKLLKRAKRANIYIHFMNMSEGAIPEDSPLLKLPNDEVNSFKSMFASLTRILTTVTNEYR